jgi:hypothetical protein
MSLTVKEVQTRSVSLGSEVTFGRCPDNFHYRTYGKRPSISPNFLSKGHARAKESGSESGSGIREREPGAGSREQNTETTPVCTSSSCTSTMLSPYHHLSPRPVTCPYLPTTPSSIPRDRNSTRIDCISQIQHSVCRHSSDVLAEVPID